MVRRNHNGSWSMPPRVGDRGHASAPGHTALVDALDRIAQGTIVVDADARVLLANRTARDILDAGDGLALDANLLRAALPEQTSQLRAAIAAAGTREGATGGALAIRRPSMRRSLWVVVAPLQAAGDDAGAPRAVLFVSDPGRHALPSASQLRRLYGLTRAEAEVSLLVARGEGLPAVAATLGITRATARTHLMHVFEKTDTNRQSELVRLLLQSGLDLAR
jgi:DNA-binding CsgD family transcriptional regulator